MTNDAERVSDIVARLRASVVYYDKAAAMVSNMRQPRTDNDNGLAAGLFEAAADIIEAQSKALAEARELVAAEKQPAGLCKRHRRRVHGRS